ncbi:MAG: HAD family hydrolase [Mycobacteriaceae bacterium]|nr:HAD family hydrolase [Mycobacteriaceae bacterium]
MSASAAGRSPAVLFDIDGTLVDSNYLHVYAWTCAFHEVGIPVDAWRIHRAIGMDGSTLVSTLSGDADDDTQQRLKDLHSGSYKELVPLLRVLPGGRDILERVSSMGLQVVLATSAPEDELSILRGLLDRDDLVSAVTSSADVDTAKPDPDIIGVALDRAGVEADQAVFVGDTVWDAKACVRAGVCCVGVRSGGVSAEELRDGGAHAVYRDTHDLVEHLADTPIADLLRS